MGGSLDSGPASNPNATNKFVVGLFVFFLGIVPLVVAVMCLVYYVRGNLGLLGLWLTKNGLPGTTRFPSGSRREGGGLCSAETGNGVGGRSSSPSSRGSKCNSPLLNGPTISAPIPVVAANGSVDGTPAVANGTTFFGKHEGFTISPINTNNKTIANGACVQESTVPSSVNSKKSCKVPPQPVRQAPGAPHTATGKISIGEPSLKGTTNRSVMTPMHSSIVPRAIPPPPPPSAPPVNGVPPVAIVTPFQHPHEPHKRPLSVPDHSSVLVGRSAATPASATSSPAYSAMCKPSTVSRLASFLSKKDKGDDGSGEDDDASKCSTLPRKAAKINRASLMQLEISAPMQLQATKLPENLVPVRPAPVPPPEPNIKPSQVKISQSYDDKSKQTNSIKTPVSEDGAKSSNKVTWAPSVDSNEKASVSTMSNSDLQRKGSMREQPVTLRPAVQKFGSMRAQRPKSLPPARPSEPPPRPPLPNIPSPGSDAYYEDCVDTPYGDTPVASLDDTTSPTEGIYATIEEETQSQEPSLITSQKKVENILEEEPFYANNEAIPQPDKQSKKSVFSFLYAKTKRKKKDNVDEPLYCNIGEGLTNNEAPECSSQSSSTSPHDRTSCGSLEDGGLLSEIVSELVTREPEFKNTLAKSKKLPLRKDDSSNFNLSADNGNNTVNHNAFKTDSTADPTPLVRVDTESNQISKSSSYPWNPSTSSTSTALPNSFSTGSNFSKPLSLKPRGVFSYIKRTVSDDKEKTKVEEVGSTPEEAFAELSSPITAVSNTTITTQIVATNCGATGRVSDEGQSSEATSSPSNITDNKPSTASTLTTSKSSTPLYTNVPNANKQTFNSKRRGSIPSKLSEEITAVIPTKLNTIKPVNITTNRKETAKNNLPKHVPSEQKPISIGLTNSCTSQLSNSVNSSVNKSLPTSGEKDTAPADSSGSSNVVNKITSGKASKPSFPPDKVRFPPDKVLATTNKSVKKDTPSSNVGTNFARGSTKDIGGVKTKNLSNRTKLVSPGSSTSLASRSSEGTTKVTAKSGRVMSPTRNSGSVKQNNASDSEKSRSVTPQPPRQEKPMGSRARSPTSPASSSVDVSKEAKKLSGSGNLRSSGRKASTAGSAGRAGSAFAGKSIGSSNVASLQQKFETTDNKSDSKPLPGKGVRKSSDAKPAITPKPKHKA